VPTHCVPRIREHKEAKQAYKDKLHNTVSSAAGECLGRARGASTERDVEAGAAVVVGGSGRAAGGAARAAAFAAAAGPVAEGFDSLVALRGAALSTAQETRGPRGGSDAGCQNAADAIAAPSAGPSVMAPAVATGLLPVHQPAARAAHKEGGAARPPRRERGARFDHLPCWRRYPARLTNRWRLFRQHVDEDAAYADAVAHRWVCRPELCGEGDGNRLHARTKPRPAAAGRRLPPAPARPPALEARALSVARPPRKSDGQRHAVKSPLVTPTPSKGGTIGWRLSSLCCTTSAPSSSSSSLSTPTTPDGRHLAAYTRGDCCTPAMQRGHRQANADAVASPVGACCLALLAPHWRSGSSGV
jgi:hypothetical protein